MREFKDVYKIVLPIVKKILNPLLDKRGNIPKRGPKPLLSDVELIAISLTSDVLFFDSENYLFSKLKRYKPSPHLIDRTVYNRRRRKLLKYIEIVQQIMADAIVPAEQYHVVDSFPLPVCRFALAKRSKICKESFDTAPSFGYKASLNIFRSVRQTSRIFIIYKKLSTSSHIASCWETKHISVIRCNWIYLNIII